MAVTVDITGIGAVIVTTGTIIVTVIVTTGTIIGMADDIAGTIMTVVAGTIVRAVAEIEDINPS